MKDIRYMCAVCVSAVILLAACGQQDGGPPASGPATQAQPVDAPISKPSQEPVAQRTDVEFAVVPASIPTCLEAPSTVKVTWQVKDTSVQEVRVEVADPGQDTWKVLSIGGRQGEVETGPWVQKATRFQLLIAATGEHLAGHVMTEEPCD